MCILACSACRQRNQRATTLTTACASRLNTRSYQRCVASIREPGAHCTYFRFMAPALHASSSDCAYRTRTRTPPDVSALSPQTSEADRSAPRGTLDARSPVVLTPALLVCPQLRPGTSPPRTHSCHLQGSPGPKCQVGRVASA